MTRNLSADRASATRSTGNDVPHTAPTEYLRVVACPGNSTISPNTDACQTATDLCFDKPGTGVMTRIYQRPLGTALPWEYVTQTCDPDAVTGPGQGPTLADILREFRETPFATPLTTMQPPDNRCLVGVPVYFTAAWPGAGYRPGQTRTVTLLGSTVQLAIKLDHYVYDYGDGTSSGPTTSLGGPYPRGTITHEYAAAGTYQPRLTAVLTADYRIGEGAWSPIGGTATRTTGFPAVTIHTATNRLRL